MYHNHSTVYHDPHDHLITSCVFALRECSSGALVDVNDKITLPLLWENSKNFIKNYCAYFCTKFKILCDFSFFTVQNVQIHIISYIYCSCVCVTAYIGSIIVASVVKLHNKPFVDIIIFSLLCGSLVFTRYYLMIAILPI